MVVRKSTSGAAKKTTSGRATSTKSSAMSGTSIVRNSTPTSGTNVNPSYNIVNMPRRRNCEKEKIGLQRVSAVSPIVATKVNDEEYKISLDYEALKGVIENFESLDLCGVNVKLCEVSGNTHFTGDVLFDKLNATEATIATLKATDADIENLVAEVSTFNGEATFKAPVTMEDVLNTNGIKNTGTIETDELDTTLIKADNGEFKELNVTEKATIEDEEVKHSHIENADIDNATITEEEVEHSHIVKADIDDEEVKHSHIEEADIDTANIEQANINNEDVNTSHIDNLEAESAIVNERLESKGETITNGIVNTGDIETDTANVKDTLTAKNADITNATILNEEVTKSHIANATIDKEEVLSSHITDLKADDVKVENNLRVKGKTTTTELEVEGDSILRGNVNIKDDLKVDWDSKFNGDLVVNWDSQFNGSEHHDGDVEIEGNLTVKGSFDVGSIEVTGYQKLTEKGLPGGYTPLDSTGKVPSQFLPDMGQGGMSFQGGWNAGTGRYPTGANIGDLFYVTNGGTVGGIEYHVGDRIVMQDGGTRFRMEDTGGVTSVNNRVGDVIGLEEVQNKVTAINKAAQSDTYYPSEKAVYDYINPIEETVKDLKETMDEWTSKEAVFEGDVVIGWDTVIEEGLTVKENVVIEKDLEVDGDATIKGDETVEGNATIKGNETVEGDVEIKGNTVMTGTTEMKDDVTMDKDLTVTGKTTINGGAEIEGGTKTDTLEVTGESILTGNTTEKGDLTVEGNTTVNTFTANGDAEFKTDVQVDNNLNVDGDTTLNNVEVKGELTLDDDLLVKGALTVNGTTTLNDDVQLDKDLNVDWIITGEVKYDNGESGLEAENVQDAIDELENNKWQKPLFAKPEGFSFFAEGDTDVTPQLELKVTTPYIDKEKKTLNVWDGTEWIDIGWGAGNSDIIYLTMEEYEALPEEEKEDPNKNYAIYINGEGGDTYLATADQIAFDKSWTDLESENVQDAIEELNNKMWTSSQMMTMEEYEELVDKKEWTFYFIYEE